jgi:hypothetical protein
MIKRLFAILILTTIGFLSKTHAQDTIKYIGKLDGFLIYESIELYSDSTFKWTSEYDLSWSEFGKYKLSDQILILNFNETDGNKVKSYMIENDKMYLIDKSGKKVKKIKDKSVKFKGSWIRFGKHDYCFYKER